jgi:F-type H+-transporting ATPase subunit delta
MSNNPLALKIATPYARALYDFSNDQNIMHQVTADFQNLEVLLKQTPDLISYLTSPIVTNVAKEEMITKTLKSQLNKETFQFLLLLVKRNRINLIQQVIDIYLNLVYDLASIKMVEVTSAFPFTNKQKNQLVKKLKDMTNAREIRLAITVDSSLIGGFLIKTDSKILDFTIKNQLQQLAKHLDSVLEI